ncbi:MAG: FmdE family protein [Miniphocaeibacter sp.]|uniref:FmdE family protein n=1 Tax=Miniphocaeibacter sp. TaxID=3100973 RepID=UPI0017ED1DBE|nr:formylmethanofuran dehydrogenase [Gallicola sp.]
MNLWEKAVKFHGHHCPGLAIGVKVCEAAMEKMGIDPDIDEEIICIAENDACGIDAIQSLLGCTVGKGNLILKNIGKQAFTFIDRKENKAMRFYLKSRNNGLERLEYQNYLLNSSIDELFNYRYVNILIPEKARIFSSVTCEICNEQTSENNIRLQDGKKLCLDCYDDYSRGW